MSFTSALTGGLIADAPDYGKMATQSEARRQGIIKLGLQQLNALYGGGSAPFYSLAPKTQFTKEMWRSGDAASKTFYHQNKKGEFVPFYAPKLANPQGETQTGAKYGLAAGSVLGPAGSVVGASLGGVIGGMKSGDYTGAALSAASGGMMPLMGSLFGWGEQPTPRQIVNKKLRRGLLFQAPKVQTFTGFNEPFYEARQKAYMDYALPQVADQYRQAQRAMTYSMANRGTQQSSMARQANSELTRASGESQQRVADSAIDQANELRRSVEAARQESIRQLYQSADPAQAMQSAINTASSFERPSAFAPVANMFGNALAQYYANRDNRMMQSAYPGYGSTTPNYLAPLTKG